MIKRAGIVDLHYHDLRHEAISRFFEKGLSIPEVSLISGHKDVRQLMRSPCSMFTIVMSWVPIGTEKPEIQPCRGPSRLRNRANLLVLKFGPIHELFSYHVAKKPIVPL